MSYSDTPVGTQRLFLEMIIHRPDLYIDVLPIFHPEYFDKSLCKAAAFIKGYEADYSNVPPLQIVIAETDVELREIPDETLNQTYWFKEEFGKFMRKEAISKKILTSADLMEENDVEGAISVMLKADELGVVDEIGTDPLSNPSDIIQKLIDSNGQVSTGWQDIDYKLYGGFNRGELNIFAGTSGAGKSTFLQNLGVNWQRAGLNGVYLSLELGEPLASRRYYSILTGIPYCEITTRKDDVLMAMNAMKMKESLGEKRIKTIPSQSTTSQIRTYVKDLISRHGIRIDYLLVDYLDLVMPVGAKVAVGDVFTKDKLVSEELRNLAQELNILLVTASQLNRSAVDAHQHDHSHIAGGISKINTADNLFSIVPNRDTGEFTVQFLKTRSSGGVGSYVKLNYNTDNLQITHQTISKFPNVQSRSGVSKTNSRQTNTQPKKLQDILTGLKGR